MMMAAADPSTDRAPACTDVMLSFDDHVPTYIACWVIVICVNEVDAIQGCQLAAKCAA